MKLFALNSINAKFILKSDLKLLVLTNKLKIYKLTVPFFIGIKKNNQYLKLFLKENLVVGSYRKIFDSLCHKIGIITENSHNSYLHKKVLILKGLGLKAILKDLSVLTLKLGYSHLININIPKHIYITVVGDTLIFESLNKEELGNFVGYIKSLKHPDQYKGKGF